MTRRAAVGRQRWRDALPAEGDPSCGPGGTAARELVDGCWSRAAAYVRDDDPPLVSREIRSLTLVCCSARLLLVAVTGFFATGWGIPTRRRR